MSLPPRIEQHGDKFRVRHYVNGVRLRRSFETLDTATAYLALVDEGLTDMRTVEAARVSGVMTIREIVDLWWLGPLVDGEHVGGHRLRVKPTTQKDYQYYIDAYISRIADESAQKYARNTPLLKAFYDTLPNRIAWHVHSVLRQVFREALVRGLIDRNPCDFEKPAPRIRTRREIPLVDEVEKLLVAAEAQDATWHLFVYLTATLGTRCGETVALRTQDFDERRGVVHIDRAVGKGIDGPYVKLPKFDKVRTLPIDDPEFWNAIRPFLDENGYLFRGYYRDLPRTADNVKPWHPDHAEKRFKKMTTACGMPEYTLHGLRHFVATQLLIAGMPINQVAEFLGNSPQMVLTLYGRHLDEPALREVGRAASRLVRAPLYATEDEVEPPIVTATKAEPIDRDAADALILELAQERTITNVAVREATGMTRRQVSKALDRLVRDGTLVRIGEKRGTRYELS